MFKFYKARDRTKYFWIENWAALLEGTGLTELAGAGRLSAYLACCIGMYGSTIRVHGEKSPSKLHCYLEVKLGTAVLKWLNARPRYYSTQA